MKIDLLKELQKVRSKEGAVNQEKLSRMRSAYQKATTLLYEQPQKKELLAEAGFSKGIGASEQAILAYRKQEGLTFLEGGPEADCIYPISQIEQIARKYKLGFYHSTDFHGLPPEEAQEEMRQLKSRFSDFSKPGSEGASSRICILCEIGSNYKETASECLLFYKLSEELYYYSCRWGKSLEVSGWQQEEQISKKAIIVLWLMLGITLLAIALFGVYGWLVREALAIGWLGKGLPLPTPEGKPEISAVLFLKHVCLSGLFAASCMSIAGGLKAYHSYDRKSLKFDAHSLKDGWDLLKGALLLLAATCLLWIFNS